MSDIIWIKVILAFVVELYLVAKYLAKLRANRSAIRPGCGLVAIKVCLVIVFLCVVPIVLALSVKTLAAQLLLFISWCFLLYLAR